MILLKRWVWEPSVERHHRSPRWILPSGPKIAVVLGAQPRCPALLASSTAGDSQCQLSIREVNQSGYNLPSVTLSSR